MEETFLRVKTERDDLIKASKDTLDGSNKTVTDEIADLKTELNRQKKGFQAQFIEYVSFPLCTARLWNKSGLDSDIFRSLRLLGKLITNFLHSEHYFHNKCIY